MSISQHQCPPQVFNSIHKNVSQLVDLLREELRKWNIKVTNILGNPPRRVFDIYYEWTHKKVLIHIFEDDFCCIDNKIYIDSEKRINFDRGMLGMETGRIPGSPTTIKGLLEEVKNKIRWVLDVASFLDPRRWLDGKWIELGKLGNEIKIAYRLLLIAVLKLSYTPISIDSHGVPRSFEFNTPLVRALL